MEDARFYMASVASVVLTGLEEGWSIRKHVYNDKTLPIRKPDIEFLVLNGAAGCIHSSTCDKETIGDYFGSVTENLQLFCGGGHGI